MHDLNLREPGCTAGRDLMEYTAAADMDPERRWPTISRGASMRSRPRARHFSSGVRSGVNGTPTFYVDGAALRGGLGQSLERVRGGAPGDCAHRVVHDALSAGEPVFPSSRSRSTRRVHERLMLRCRRSSISGQRRPACSGQILSRHDTGRRVAVRGHRAAATAQLGVAIPLLVGLIFHAAIDQCVRQVGAVSVGFGSFPARLAVAQRRWSTPRSAWPSRSSSARRRPTRTSPRVRRRPSPHSRAACSSRSALQPPRGPPVRRRGSDCREDFPANLRTPRCVPSPCSAAASCRRCWWLIIWPLRRFFVERRDTQRAATAASASYALAAPSVHIESRQSRIPSPRSSRRLVFDPQPFARTGRSAGLSRRCSRRPSAFARAWLSSPPNSGGSFQTIGRARQALSQD